MKELNFERDLIDGISDIAFELGFRINFSQPFYNILLDYLTVRTKIIERHPRQILINPSLKSTLPHHPKKAEIEFIIQCARWGGDLNKFQSKRLLQAKFQDHLLNEWRIYHFHLSLKPDKDKKFVKQVDSLLFAYIDELQVVFLETEKHSEGIFGDPKWIKILHDHFPSIIAEHKDEVIKDIFPKLDDKDRQILWNKGYTIPMQKIEDTVYKVPGIGRSLSGHGFLVTTTLNRLVRWIYKLKLEVTEYHDDLCHEFGIEKEKAHFSLCMKTPKISLIENSTSQTLLTFPETRTIEKIEQKD